METLNDFLTRMSKHKPLPTLYKYQGNQMHLKPVTVAITFQGKPWVADGEELGRFYDEKDDITIIAFRIPGEEEMFKIAEKIVERWRGY